MKRLEALKHWTEANRSGWKTATLAQIANETDTAISSVHKLLPEAVCLALNPERHPDGMLPSKVAKIRIRNRKNRNNQRRILKAIKENPNWDARDIAYVTEANLQTVRKVLKHYREGVAT